MYGWPIIGELHTGSLDVTNSAIVTNMKIGFQRDQRMGYRLIKIRIPWGIPWQRYNYLMKC